MKKILAVAIALVMTFALTSTAFAEVGDTDYISVNFADYTFQTDHPVVAEGTLGTWSYEVEGFKITAQGEGMCFDVACSLDFNGANSIFKVESTGNRRITEATLTYAPSYSETGTTHYGFTNTHYISFDSETENNTPNSFVFSIDGAPSSDLISSSSTDSIDPEEPISSYSFACADTPTNFAKLVSITLTYVEVEEPTTGETTTAATPTTGATTATTATSATSPKTGDTLGASFWLAMAVVAALGTATIVVYRKKEQ